MTQGLLLTTKYINNAADIGVSKSNGANGLNAGNLNDFENYFDAANKAYEPKETQKEFCSRDNSINEKKESIKADEKVDETSDNKSDNIADSKIKENANGEASNKVNNDNQKTENKGDKEVISQKNTNNTENVSVNNNPAQNVENKTTEVNDTNIENVKSVIVDLLLSGISVEENTATQDLKALPAETSDANKNVENQSKTENNSQLQNQPIIMTEELIEALKTYSNATDKEISKLAQDLLNQQAIYYNKNQNILQVNANNANQQVNQTLLQENAKSQQQSIVQQATPQQSAPQQQVADLPNVQTEVIKVSSEVIASDVSVNTKDADTIQNVKDMLNKTILNQDILNKTNARVVNVETNNSANSNNAGLFGQQNPQEQVVKLSLEGATFNADTLDVEGNAVGLDSAQLSSNRSIEAIKPQAPKEISNSDILSQIHSKLDKFQEEGTTKVTIVLRPENLGKINLELVNGKDGLVARMTTDNAQVKELLDKNLESLRDTLGSQGVSVNNVSVKLNEVQKQSNDMFSFDDKANSNNQQLSDNAQNPKSGDSSFSDGFENLSASGDFESESADKEDLELSSSHSGQVDYKI